MNRSTPEAVDTPVSTKDRVETASPARFSANVHERLPGPQANSPQVDLPSETTAGPKVIYKKKPTRLSHQQLISFVPHPSAQRPVWNSIEPELETALCSPDNNETPGLQVKAISYSEPKRSFADAGTQEEQEQFQREKTASPSRSRVGPFKIPPRANYRTKMEKYRALQRSQNFTTSTTEEEVASHGSPAVSQVLSATKPISISHPRKKTSPMASPKTSPMASPKTSPKPSPGRKTGTRKSGIQHCRSDGARKRKNDQICPAQAEEIPGQVDDKKERVDGSQTHRAERTSDMEKKTAKQNSQSPSSSGAEQSCCNRSEHKSSEKRTVKRRWLPLPSEATPQKLYGPVFCRMHRQKAKRDAAKKSKYRTKLEAIPEEPENIDPKWDEPRRNFVQEWEEYCKGVFERFAEMDRFYAEREARRDERTAKLVAESENPELLYEIGLIPHFEAKPVAEKVDEEPKERFLKRRERPASTDPKVEEEIDKLCAEEGIVLSTEGTSSTNSILSEISVEEEDEILEWLEEEMNKNIRRSSSSLYSQYNWPI